MSKLKPNKGLLKRIRITANGKVKVRRAFGGHSPESQVRQFDAFIQ